MTELTATANATTDEQLPDRPDTEPRFDPDDDRLDAETQIVWKEDPEQYEYVRSGFAITQKKEGDMPGRVSRPRAKIVGYAEIDRSGPQFHAGMRPRRYFYLKNGDRPIDGDGFSPPKNPAEAVDPRTVGIGVPGEVTPRVRGRDA